MFKFYSIFHLQLIIIKILTNKNHNQNQNYIFYKKITNTALELVNFLSKISNQHQKQSNQKTLVPVWYLIIRTNFFILQILGIFIIFSLDFRYAKFSNWQAVIGYISIFFTYIIYVFKLVNFKENMYYIFLNI